MPETTNDLIKIIVYNKKKKPTDDSEVMTSEDDKNPEGDQSNGTEYNVYIDPGILEMMKKKKATSLRVVSKGTGNRRLRIVFE